MLGFLDDAIELLDAERGATELIEGGGEVIGRGRRHRNGRRFVNDRPPSRSSSIERQQRNRVPVFRRRGRGAGGRGAKEVIKARRKEQGKREALLRMQGRCRGGMEFSTF